jgi:cell division protein FtsB
MRIRRSIARTVTALIFPAICLAAIGYFGYFTIAGPRGLIALGDARQQLSNEQAAFALIDDHRQSLAHRVDLLSKGDPDLIEEIRRDQNLGVLPGEIGVDRGSH